MLPFLTLAFIGGLAVGSLVPYYPLTVSASLCLLTAALSLSAVRARMAAAPTAASLACLLGGMLYWFLAVEGGSKAPFHESDPETFQSCSGRVVAPVQYSPGRMLMVVRCEADADGGSLVLRVTWRAADRRVFQGDRIAVRAKLRAPSGSLNPGGFNYAAYLEHQGIDAVATVNGLEAVEILESGHESLRWSIWNRVDHWRDAIRLAALQSLEPPAVGLFLGVVIGERGYLDPELRDQFMITGTVHLLSISGSHLGLVAMLSFVAIKQGCLWLPASWLLRMSRRITATRLAAAVTLFPASAYACLAGAEVATVRSLVMVLVALAAKWLGYEQRIFHALAAAALAIVLHDPQVIYDISFQLSFLSVCAVGWRLSQAPRVEEEGVERPSRLARAGQWGMEALVMSAVVTITTMPLVAFYFNQVSWLGLVTNLIAVPVMGGLLVPLGLLAALWHEGGDAAGLPFAAVIQWSMDSFVSVLADIAQLPGSEWHLAAPALPSLLLFYACLAGLWVGFQQWCLRWVTGTILLLLFGWWMWSPKVWLDGDRFRVMFLDVGQGDSAVLELPSGEVVLIDGGASYERFDMGRGVVAPYLWNRGIRTIDYVIATHPQLDHVGGLAYVLRHFTVRHFWGTGDVRDEAFYHRLQEALAARGLREHVVRQRQDMVALGGCRLDVLNPPPESPVHHAAGGRKREGRMLNNRSIVTALSCGRHRILFTADVEQDALLRMSRDEEAAAADLVKVPHHGAASSQLPEWLARANPRYAVISVGRHNAYGHPADGVLQAYGARKIAMYRTDVDGGIWVTGRCSAPGLQLHRTRDQQVQRVPFPRCLWACERLNWERVIHRWRD